MTECEVCGREINTTTDAYYQRMSGWAKIRKDGGPNTITNPVRENVFRCNTCVRTQIDGQLQML